MEYTRGPLNQAQDLLARFSASFDLVDIVSRPHERVTFFQPPFSRRNTPYRGLHLVSDQHDVGIIPFAASNGVTMGEMSGGILMAFNRYPRLLLKFIRKGRGPMPLLTQLNPKDNIFITSDHNPEYQIFGTLAPHSNQTNPEVPVFWNLEVREESGILYVHRFRNFAQ